MKSIKMIITSFLMLAVFASFFNPFGNSFSEKRKMAISISKKLSKRYKTKYGLRYAGISESALDGKYDTIGLELDYNKILSKDKGRILLLHCVKDQGDFMRIS